MPTYEKFSKNVGVRCIRWGHVFYKLRTRYHTLAYVGVRCHTSNRAENFVHAQNFQRMPTYWLYVRHTLLIRNMYVMHTFTYVTCTLLTRSHTFAYVAARCKLVYRSCSVCITYFERTGNALLTDE